MTLPRLRPFLWVIVVLGALACDDGDDASPTEDAVVADAAPADAAPADAAPADAAPADAAPADAAPADAAPADAAPADAAPADAAPADAAPADAAPADAAPPPIPVMIAPSNDYPAHRVDIEAWTAAGDIDAVREHAWHVWAGMTAPSGQRHDGINLPIWDTWRGSEQIFTARDGVVDDAAAHRTFESPTQSAHNGVEAETQVISFNKFNPPMADYLLAAHPGPDGQMYRYTEQASLAALDSAFRMAGTPAADRKVVDAPYDQANGIAAIEIKPVLNLVKADGLTPVPLWRGYAGDAVTAGAITQRAQQGAGPTGPFACTGAAAGTQAVLGPGHATWTSCVILDPTGADGAPETALRMATPEEVAAAQMNAGVNGTGGCATYWYAPLGAIYHFELSRTEAERFRSAQNIGGAEPGDFAVLVAMHANTKESINWTWQTFWWQPGEDVARDKCRYDQDGVAVDAPGSTGCPGSKQGMTANVTGVWRNYAMCTSYSEQELFDQATPTRCYNPFLETDGIPDGVRSNCMSCHGTASVRSMDGANGLSFLGYPVPYDNPIGFGSGQALDGPLNACFNDFTRTDFSWAIPFKAVAPVSNGN